MNSDEKHLIVKRSSKTILVDVLILGKCLTSKRHKKSQIEKI